MNKVFIDTNIIFSLLKIRNENALLWVKQLYEEVYIHETVLEELRYPTTKERVQELIDSKEWILFEESTLTVTQSKEYQNIIKRLFITFENLTNSKYGNSPKKPSNLGEIYSIAAAAVINANVITSNDLSVKEAIEIEKIMIIPEDDMNAEATLINQDTLEDFCFYCVENKICKEKIASYVIRDTYNNPIDKEIKLNSFKLRLNELTQMAE